MWPPGRIGWERNAVHRAEKGVFGRPCGWNPAYPRNHDQGLGQPGPRWARAGGVAPVGESTGPRTGRLARCCGGRCPPYISRPALWWAMPTLHLAQRCGGRCPPYIWLRLGRGWVRLRCGWVRFGGSASELGGVRLGGELRKSLPGRRLRNAGAGTGIRQRWVRSVKTHER